MGEGYLVIKRSWPSSMRTLSGDHQRFENVYFSNFKGYYMTGDGARRDSDGYYWLIGESSKERLGLCLAPAERQGMMKLCSEITGGSGI